MVQGAGARRRGTGRPGLLSLVLLQLLAGTVICTLAEGWRRLDALDCCVATLPSAGYGDLFPSTDLGRIFTMIQVLTGVGVLVGFVDLLAQHFLAPRYLLPSSSVQEDGGAGRSVLGMIVCPQSSMIRGVLSPRAGPVVTDR